MKSIRLLTLGLPWAFVILLAPSLPLAAQSVAVEWHRFSTDSDKLSFSFPDPATVVNQKTYSDLYYDDASLSLSFSRQEFTDTRKWVKEFDTPPNESVLDIHSDKKITVRRFDSRIEGASWSHIMLASSCCLYRFTVAAAIGKEDLMDKYLGSIVFDGIAVITQKPQASSPAESVQKLPSSPLVAEMMNKRCDVGSIPVMFDNENAVKPGLVALPKSDAAFPITRQLTILTKPRAEGMSVGSVQLKVNFGADGCIGSIGVIKGGRDASTGAAIKAAAEIKFIPVMIAGKFASVTKMVEYSLY